MQNIVKSTYRNFVRKPATNLINLLGLAVSLALVIILSVYSYSELTTDNYHKNGDRVYLFAKENNAIYSPAVLKDQIDLSVPDVEATVRMASMWQAPVFQAGNREPITSDMVFADAATCAGNRYIKQLFDLGFFRLPKGSFKLFKRVRYLLFNRVGQFARLRFYFRRRFADAA